MKVKIIAFLGAIFLLALSYFFISIYPQIPIANGYAAKAMCSCTFIANRTQESIQSEDLDLGPLTMTRTKIDHKNKSVTSSIFGLRPRTAVFREKLGCVLLQGKDDYNGSLRIEHKQLNINRLWPFGESTNYNEYQENVNYRMLEEAIADAFDSSLKMDSIKTRAVIVVYKGQLIGEKYSTGFDPETEILGWSMTKSITATLIGIMKKNGQLTLSDNQLFSEWKDDRKDITLKDMLQMQSGLAFEEEYETVGDATNMLFNSEDVSRIPKANKLIHPPGSYWSYSSGTTNLLSDFIRTKIGDQNAYLRFPYDSLFYRMGMNSAVMETDESGRYIGSSYCYATPRDWAKLGLLYLNQGNWFGDQIIDSSWVDFVRTPASASKGIYGGHFWLNAGHSAYPDIPEDLFSCNGFQGQYVFIIPAYDLVVVRMGLTDQPTIDLNKFLKEILISIKAN